MLKAVMSYMPALTSPSNKIPLPFGRRVACIGTSLVQQNMSATSGRCSSWSRGWWPWAMAYMNRSAYHVNWWDPTVLTGWEPSGINGTTRYFQGMNFGVSGQTSTQVLDRVPYILQNFKDSFDIIVVDAGTNDIAGGNAATIHNNRKAICDAFLNAGKKVVLLTILNRDTSSWAAGSQARNTAYHINQLTYDYERKTKNLYVYDWNKSWVDGTSANSVPQTGFSHDGIHFNPKGGEAVGYDLAQFMLSTILPIGNPRVISQDDTFNATYNPYGNLLSNPLLQGTAGANGTGASGTVATNMRVERSSGTACTVVNSMEARTYNKGNFQVLTFTMSGTAQELFYFRTNTADTTHSLAGKWVVASAEVQTNNSDQITGITVYAKDQNGTSGIEVDAMYPFSPNNDGNNEYWAARTRGTILLETPALLLKSDSTTIRFRVEIRVKGGGSVDPIVKIGAVELRQVPDPTVFV